jgi:hypothetical protein
MSPESLAVIEKLSTMGGNVGMLLVATYFLARLLKGQYETRITALEKRSDDCESDRREMHRTIHTMQDERIGILEKLLAEREHDHGSAA